MTTHFTGGTLHIQIDGVGEGLSNAGTTGRDGSGSFSAIGDFSIRGFRFVKEPRANLDGSITVTRRPNVVGFTGTFTKNNVGDAVFQQLEALGEGTSGNATISTDSQTFTYRGVFVVGEPMFDPVEGTITIEFAAQDFHESGRRA